MLLHRVNNHIHTLTDWKATSVFKQGLADFSADKVYVFQSCIYEN